MTRLFNIYIMETMESTEHQVLFCKEYFPKNSHWEGQYKKCLAPPFLLSAYC